MGQKWKERERMDVVEGAVARVLAKVLSTRAGWRKLLGGEKVVVALWKGRLPR